MVAGPLIMNGDLGGNLPKLELNPYGWSQTLNMLYIDMPVGTGFSYSETQEGYYSDDKLWVEHTYQFLQKVNHSSQPLNFYSSSILMPCFSINYIFLYFYRY